MRNKAINILAIDDNQDNLITIQALTSEAFPNANISMALSGREGLELAIAERPNVILLDIVMPDMDGFEVCRAIKSNPLTSDIPIVFVTALKGDKESRIRGLEAGGDAFLAKPIDESELVAQIRAMVKINNANQEKKSEQQRLEGLVAKQMAELNSTHLATLNLMEDLRTEIEARKETENALRESEEKFRDMANLLPQVIFEITLDGSITYVNQQAEELFGYSTQELIGKSHAMIHIAEELDFAKECITKKINAESIPNKEFTLVHKDGSRIPGFISISPIVKGDKIIGVRGVIIDMTEQKQAENALRESETLYKAIIEASPDSIIITDTTGNIEIFSSSSLNRFGYDNEKQIIGKNIVNFIGNSDINKVQNDFSMMMKGIKTGPNEYKTIRRDNSIMDIEVNGGLIKDVNGKISKLVFVARDITEKKHAQEALIESENRYVTFINNNVNLIFVKDDQFRYLVVNDALAEFYGKTKEEILNKTDEQLASKNIIAPCISSDIKALNANESFTIEETLGERVYETIKFPMQLGNNKRWIGGIMRDITSRRISEEALKDSQRELQAIYDNAPVMMALIDEESSILFTNKAFISMKGKAPDDLTKNKVGDVLGCINSTDNELGCGYGQNCKDCSLQTSIGQTFKTGKGIKDIDYTFRYSINKKIFEKNLVGSTAIIKHKNQKNLLLCFHDISDRKNAEDALQKSESLLRSFIDNTPFEIWARDIDKVGILENKKFVENYGSIIGVSPENDKRINDKIRKSWKRVNRKVYKGETVDEVYEFNVKDEKRIYQQIVFPIRNLSKIIGIAGFNIDITERKAAEKALSESQVQLKKFAAHLQNIREEERTVLAREIHDDLGQILVAIKIDVGILKQSILKSTSDNATSKLMVEFEKLLQLVDTTIKTTRRIMTNLRPEVLDMLGFIEAVKQYLKGYEDRHKVKCILINNSTDIELNPQQGVALYRIIQETLNNVAKHAKASQVKVSIIKDTNKLTLEVIDNGIGFDSTKKMRPDSYGLIGMKERMYLLDGELFISSKLGKGTNVKVTINI